MNRRVLHRRMLHRGVLHKGMLHRKALPGRDAAHCDAVEISREGCHTEGCCAEGICTERCCTSCAQHMHADHTKHRQAGIDEKATAMVFLAALPDESSVDTYTGFEIGTCLSNRTTSDGRCWNMSCLISCQPSVTGLLPYVLYKESISACRSSFLPRKLPCKS